MTNTSTPDPILSPRPRRQRRAPSASPRDKLKFRGVALRLGDDLERRLDLLALRLGFFEGAKRSGRRARAARAALLRGLDAFDTDQPTNNKENSR